MGADLTVTSTEIARCRQGILMHLQATNIDLNHGSFSAAMEELGMWDFVDNMAEVIAYHQADSRRLNEYLHQP